MLLALLRSVQRLPLQPDAVLGTGLEWMTVGAVVVPALLLVLLAYLGQQNTV